MANWRTWWEEAFVQEYLNFGDDGIPCRQEQFDILFSILPADKTAALRLLDLGCGDGVLLETLLRSYPNVSRAAAVDGALPMIDRARARLIDYPSVELVLADLATAEWSDVLGKRGNFDIIVSRFAIHHLEDDDKRMLFRRVYGLLDLAGTFVNIEHVRSRSARGEQLFESWYAAHLIRMERTQGRDRCSEEIIARFRDRPGKKANRLAPVEDQMRWMDEAGFEDVDCIWKAFELAIMVGFRGGQK